MPTTVLSRALAASWLAALLCVLPACADGDEPAKGSGSDVVSDSTSDATSDVSADGGDPDIADDTDEEDASDLPYVSEINTDINVYEVFDIDPDSLADAEDDAGDADGDGQGDADDAADGDGDAGPDEDVFAGQCEELGIADAWVGTFEGEIEYDVDSGGLLDPEQGIIPVSGELSFEITCVNSKLVVSGEMDGFATVQGQGDFPFTLTLSGYYNPTTGELTAQMIDGAVSVFEVIEIYFDGDFDGLLQEDGTFLGTWAGESDGTNQEWITGTATGDGTWEASEDPGTAP